MSASASSSKNNANTGLLMDQFQSLSDRLTAVERQCESELQDVKNNVSKKDAVVQKYSNLLFRLKRCMDMVFANQSSPSSSRSNLGNRSPKKNNTRKVTFSANAKTVNGKAAVVNRKAAASNDANPNNPGVYTSSPSPASRMRVAQVISNAYMMSQAAKANPPEPSKPVKSPQNIVDIKPRANKK